MFHIRSGPHPSLGFLRDQNRDSRRGFRAVDVFPSRNEILFFTKDLLLKPNIVSGNYESLETYLEIHFRLLRQDFVCSLQRGISHYYKRAPSQDIDVYYNVELQSCLSSNLVEYICAIIDEEIDQNSKKFMHGSLLLFINGKDLFLATVVRTWERGAIRIKFVDSAKKIFLNVKTYTMIECRTFFVPYYHVLRILKSYNYFNFPMADIIVHGRYSRKKPEYLINKKIVLSQNDMDIAQYKAFYETFNNKFTLIQGPPGTGKTFVGVQIVKTLIENKKLWYSKTPILIISQKNRVLDQFLERLIPITHDIVRVGSRSKSEALQKYRISKKRDSIAGISRRMIMWEDLPILRDHLIVGMTTTAAATMKEVLNALKSPIVIVEEAAEVIESHIIAALTKNCQHLILLGDHEQLQPFTSTSIIGEKYKLKTSLFKRMIDNGMPYSRLEVQYRMQPEISRLVQGTIYPFLQDHESVSKRPNIQGVSKNLLFINHRCSEIPGAFSSQKNVYEAKFLVLFAHYLLQNGYAQSDIAILTMYSSQAAYILNIINKGELKEPMNEVKVATLDSFQGQEAKIILLSLVRTCKIGFLENKNRICVALSRAKDGLYIMGNIELLIEGHSLMWRTIREILNKQNAIRRTVSLKCHLHGNIVEIKNLEDFHLVSNGGCGEYCGEQLPCGHICKAICPLEHSHELSCKEICRRKLCKINGDHAKTCEKYCFEECSPCEETSAVVKPSGEGILVKCNLEHLPASKNMCIIS